MLNLTTLGVRTLTANISATAVSPHQESNTSRILGTMKPNRKEGVQRVVKLGGNLDGHL